MVIRPSTRPSHPRLRFGRPATTSREHLKRKGNAMHAHTERRCYLAMLLALPMLIAACGQTTSTPADGGTSTSNQLRVAYLPITTALPAWVAQEQGFFKQNNLDVTLTSSPNINTLPPLMGKQFDVALSTQPDLIKAVSNSIDVVQVAGDALDTAKNPTVLIMVRPDSGIHTIADLKGKRIAAPSLGGNIQLAFLNLLQQNGVPPDSIRAVQLSSPNIPDQLTAKQVDAAEVLQPFANDLLAKGNVSLGDPFRSIGASVGQTFWISDRNWAEAHRDMIARWVKSLEQAKEFIRTNDKQARDILQKYTKQPADVVATTPLPDYSFTVDAKELQTWVDVIKQVGGLNPRVDSAKLVLTP